MSAASSHTWKEVALLDLVEITSGQVDPRASPYRDLPLIAPDHIESKTGRLLRKDTAASQGAVSGKFLVKPGDVVYSKIRPYLQKAFKCDFECLCSADMYPLTSRRVTDSSFILHTLLGDDFTRFATSVSARSGIPKINRVELAGYRTAVPLYEEQAVIGRALDEADGLIYCLELLIAKWQTIKEGMLQQLLTGRTRLPGFTLPWTDVRLGNHVTYLRTAALSRACLDTISPLRYLHYGDIHTRTASRLDAATEPMPRTPERLARNAGRLQVGDIVFADASEDPDGVGKSVEITSVPVEGVVPGLHTIAARFDKAVLADSFKAYLQFVPAFRASLLRMAAGTKVLATTRAYISNVELSLPSNDEQRAIARVLRDCELHISALEGRLDKARFVKRGMAEQLLTGRTRIRVNDST